MCRMSMSTPAGAAGTASVAVLSGWGFDWVGLLLVLLPSLLLLLFLMLSRLTEAFLLRVRVGGRGGNICLRSCLLVRGDNMCMEYSFWNLVLEVETGLKKYKKKPSTSEIS